MQAVNMAALNVEVGRVATRRIHADNRDVVHESSMS